ncbi:protein CHUP1, chloroplastic-like [Bidens hawaiensis]|uniref:protein CHUP1, chloroplastic-like n=1 Tax=Bidens hawaiensis TaxID=980011 RepID=UPI0040493962
MEITRSQELIKSILIMAGIPLAFSVTCSLFSRFKEKKNASLHDQIQETNSENVDHLKEHIFTLKCKIEELQELEREIEVRFFKFIELKDQEHALIEVQNGLRMEKERAELLEREVPPTEEHNKKFDEMVIEYLNALEELKSLRLENKVVRKREKNVLRKNKESLRLIVKQKLKIEAQEEEMLSNEVELKRKDVVIEGFEREVEVMRVEIDRLENEKSEALNKLETVENEVVSKAEAERILVENYNRVVNELENIKKDRANELKELIYLRWCHACLRHELARRKELEQQTEHDEEIVNNNNHEPGLELTQNVAPEECKGHESDNENVVHHDEPFFGPGQQHKKRRWLVRKFKKWVEGNDKPHEIKCFGSHSVVDETEERHEAGRKSCSSV